MNFNSQNCVYTPTPFRKIGVTNGPPLSKKSTNNEDVMSGDDVRLSSKFCSASNLGSVAVPNSENVANSYTLGRKSAKFGHLTSFNNFKSFASTGHLAFGSKESEYADIKETDTLPPPYKLSYIDSKVSGKDQNEKDKVEKKLNSLRASTQSLLQQPQHYSFPAKSTLNHTNIITSPDHNSVNLNKYTDNTKVKTLHSSKSFSHCGTLPLNKRNKLKLAFLGRDSPLQRTTSMRIKDEEDCSYMSKSHIETLSTSSNGLKKCNQICEKSKDSKTGPTQSKSFRDKLSKSFYDLANGSQDRLQKWKSKLHTGKKPREKDSSCPPPQERRERSSFREPNRIKRTTSSTEFESAVNNKNILQNNISKVKSHTVSKLSLNTDISTFKPPTTKTESIEDKDMEHRTLRVRDNNSLMHSSMKASYHEGTQHERNMKTLQDLVKTIESYPSQVEKTVKDYQLPPPCRIISYSGVRPEDNAIIRPIAFRPIGSQGVNKTSNTSYASKTIDINCNNTHPNYLPTTMKTSPTSRDSYASAIQNHPTVHDQSKQAPPPYQSSFGGVNRPKILQKNNNMMSASQYLQQHDKEENDYDVVADYDLKDRVMSDGSSETYSYLPSSSHKNPVHGSGNNMTSSYSNSIKSISSRSPGPNTKTLQNQVTQSPSDSGIVDYETIIKDKENELNNVRQTMEANEEVLVRVYQDKERSFRSEIVDLKQKLKASQQGESGLRSQMQISEEQREQMALTIKALQSDKNVMAQKCSQIEKELYGMKNRIQEMAAEKVLAKNKAFTCDNCRLGKNFMTGSYMGNDKYHSSNGSSPNSLLHMSYMTNSVAPPVPAPRQSKEMDTNLRGEVESLRNELKSMKDMFKEQIQKWEKDDVNVNNNICSEMTYKGNEPVGRSKTMSHYKPMVTDHHTIRKPIISSDRLI